MFDRITDPYLLTDLYYHYFTQLVLSELKIFTNSHKILLNLRVKCGLYESREYYYYKKYGVYEACDYYYYKIFGSTKWIRNIKLIKENNNFKNI